MTLEQIDNCFALRVPRSLDLNTFATLRTHAREFALAINALCPDSSDKIAAIRKTREAVLTALAAIEKNGK